MYTKPCGQHGTITLYICYNTILTVFAAVHQIKINIFMDYERPIQKALR